MEPAGDDSGWETYEISPFFKEEHFHKTDKILFQPGFFGGKKYRPRRKRVETFTAVGSMEMKKCIDHWKNRRPPTSAPFGQTFNVAKKNANTFSIPS